MSIRLKAWLITLGILLVPVLLMFPVMAISGFGPCGPSNLWAIVMWALIAGGAGVFAIFHLYKSHQSGSRDWLSIVRFPLWLAGALFAAIGAAVLFLLLPGIVFDIATHLLWFFLFLIITLIGGLVWLYLRISARRHSASSLE